MPKLFAHRGGMAHAPQNTLAAFRRATAHGATGLETDAFLTRDGAVVLAHDPLVTPGPRAIRDLDRAALPVEVPTLDDLLDLAGPHCDLFVDVKDDAAFPVLAASVLRHRDPADLRLWLAHADFERSDRQVVTSWAGTLPGAHLVDSTSAARLGPDPARYLAGLAAGPIGWLNLPITDWTPALVTACRAAGLQTMAFRVHDADRAAQAVDLGLDAVHGDDVDALVDVVARRAA